MLKRYWTVGAITFVVMAAGSLAAQEKKPYPIFTPDHFVAAMKTVGQAYTAVNNTLGRNEVEDAKAYLAITRDRLATTITFWRDRKREDAVKLLRESLKKLDELDVALSAEKVDVAATSAIAKQVGATCQACHAIFRDQDPETKAYRIKPGSVQ